MYAWSPKVGLAIQEVSVLPFVSAPVCGMMTVFVFAAGALHTTDVPIV